MWQAGHSGVQVGQWKGLAGGVGFERSVENFSMGVPRISRNIQKPQMQNRRQGYPQSEPSFDGLGPGQLGHWLRSWQRVPNRQTCTLSTWRLFQNQITSIPGEGTA